MFGKTLPPSHPPKHYVYATPMTSADFCAFACKWSNPLYNYSCRTLVNCWETTRPWPLAVSAEYRDQMDRRQICAMSMQSSHPRDASDQAGPPSIYYNNYLSFTINIVFYNNHLNCIKIHEIIPIHLLITNCTLQILVRNHLQICCNGPHPYSILGCAVNATVTFRNWHSKFKLERSSHIMRNIGGVGKKYPKLL